MTSIKRTSLILCALILVLGLIAGCSNNNENNNKNTQGPATTNNNETPDNETNQPSDELQKVQVVLDWTPNTNHTGLYVAKDQGYYEEAGLDVDIILPGDASVIQLTASGSAQFGISFQEDVTLARTANDVPVVSIAAIIQHNTSGFASPVEKGIVSPKDFEGKVYGSWGSAVEKPIMDLIMQTEGADVEKVTFADMGMSDYFTAVNNDIDFAWVFYAWDGIKAELIDQEMNMIYIKDYSENLDYYTPVIITSEKMIEDQPETVKAFIEATTKGYQFAIEKPEAAADILLAAEPDLDPELVKASQLWLADKYIDDAERWGEQALSRWENYANWLYENDLLEKPLDAQAAFTNEFLPE